LGQENTLAVNKKSYRKHAVGRAARGKVFRFALGLWSVIAMVVLFAPTPYALISILLGTFLHFAALEENA